MVLDVFLLGNRVGALKNEGGSSFFRYDDDYAGPPISVSMPLGAEQRSEPHSAGSIYVPSFFRNLLPQGENLKDIVRKNPSLKNNQWEMLSLVAGLGGIDIMSKYDSAPNIINMDGLNMRVADDIIESVSNMSSNRAVKISIAGMQRKRLVVLEEDGHIREPKDGEMWTHILKIPSILNKSMAQNEHLMIKSISDAGVEAARTSCFDFDGNSFFITERFDIVDGKRIMQEELLSAFGDGPDEMFTYGYDTLSKKVLEMGLEESEIKNMVRQISISAFLCNGDLHEKNISLHNVDGKLVVSPIYDVLNTRVMGDNSMALPIEAGYSSSWDVDRLIDIYELFGLSNKDMNKDLKVIKKILCNVKKNIGVVANGDIRDAILSDIGKSEIKLGKMIGAARYLQM